MNIAVDSTRHNHPHRVTYLGGITILWLVAFALYICVLHGNPVLPLISTVVLGVIFPLIVFGMTRNHPQQVRHVHYRPDELWFAYVYLVVFAVVILGWGFTAARNHIHSALAQETFLLLLKLVTMVAIPWSLMRSEERGYLCGPSLRIKKPILRLALVLGILSAFISTFATGAVPLLKAEATSATQALLGLVGTTIWVSLGAALCEELLFRAYLQPRIEFALHSKWGGIAVGALIFAFIHVPGLYLRADQAVLMHNGSPSLSACALYAITVLSPPGVLFAIIWARTRNLALLMIVHAMIDIPSNIAPFLHLWK